MFFLNKNSKEKPKEPSPVKEIPIDKVDSPSRADKKPEDESPPESLPKQSPPKSCPSSTVEFDSSFYSNVSCNIRENLLHHLDGKLQSSVATGQSPLSPDASKQPTILYEHTSNQIQFPIDISLTAATPVNKEYNSEEYENSSEYARKPGKTAHSHPRRVSFEKYNFPRKYDGREQWTCSIKVS